VLELDGTSFSVHESVICAKAPFFKAALQHEWAEGQERKVTLTETEADVFEAYAHWAYSGIVDATAISKSTPSSDAKLKLPTYLALGKLWIFADKVLDFELCNRLSDSTLEKAQENSAKIALGSLAYLWPRTSKDSPLRKLHVDMYADIVPAFNLRQYHPNHDRREWWHKYMTKGATEDIKVKLVDFFIDIASTVIAQNRDLTKSLIFDENWNIRSGVGCRYHRHEDGNKCED
jgi:hypothetical protein